MLDAMFFPEVEREARLEHFHKNEWRHFFQEEGLYVRGFSRALLLFAPVASRSGFISVIVILAGCVSSVVSDKFDGVQRARWKLVVMYSIPKPSKPTFWLNLHRRKQNKSN
ncbi:hypothetical protein ISCGN_000591 [Ixodes scapularis]